MRAWFKQVSSFLCTLLKTILTLAVNIIDRFLSLRVVSLVKLQLVGLTSLFIASKYEEVISPSIQNFLYMAEDGYTEDEIVRAERYVLQVLKFSLHYPTPMSFLRRSSKADDYDIQTRTLAKYLMEITLLDHRFLGVVGSAVAASAHYLARFMLNRGSWVSSFCASLDGPNPVTRLSHGHRSWLIDRYILDKTLTYRHQILFIILDIPKKSLNTRYSWC